MQTKRITALVMALVMVLSGTGLYVAKKEAKAAVSSVLPAVSGLYVAEYFDWDNDKVKTDTDGAGNTVLVNGDGEQIRYQDQDNPDYLTDGIKDGWGMGFDNNDEKWFDYVDVKTGKITHVNPSDLVITHLDGTPCDKITVTAKEEDSRVAVFHVKELERVKITYKGAEINNTMIGEFELRSGFYMSETMSLASQITGDVNVAYGKTKELYFHMADSWEEAGFSIDEANAVTVRYWNREKERDVELSGGDAEEFVTLTPVSVTDSHHLVYRVSVQGKDVNDDHFEIIINFTKFNQNDTSDSWGEDRRVNIRLVEANSLYAADFNDLTVKGNQYIYPQSANYTGNGYFSAGNMTGPVYLKFKVSDEDGNLAAVTDLSKLTVYKSYWDESLEKDVYESVENGVLKVEKAYADSDIIKVSYLGDPVEFGNEYVITYDGMKPKEDVMDNIVVAFSTAIFSEVTTYSSTSVSESTFAKEFKTDGTKDVEIYAVSVDVADRIFWNTINSVELKEIRLVDENGNDLSAKVTTDKKAVLTETTGRKLIYSEKITIPKGTLKASAKLNLRFSINSTGGDKVVRDYDVQENAYIFYSEPVADTSDQVTPTPVPTPDTSTTGTSDENKQTQTTVPEKGTKATVNGATYKVTATGKSKTVSYTKAKKNAKSVTIPKTVKIDGTTFKVTQITAKALKGNKKLTKVTIGKNVTTIGAKAFYGCKKLKTITIQGTALKKVGSKAFTGVPKKATAKVPKKKKSAYKKLLKKGGYKGKVK